LLVVLVELVGFGVGEERWKVAAASA